jgi:prepilin-type N-terminal cleavage/methylation domain-containing protein
MQKNRQQAGFTLIELLVVLGIMGVLAALGVQSYDQVRETVYRTTNERIALDAFTSLQAGQIDSDQFGSNWYGAVWLKGNMQWNAGDPSEWAPGISGQGNMYLYASVDNWVSETSCPNCSKYYVYVRQCGAKVAHVRYETGAGQTHTWNNVDTWSCR